MNFEKLEQEWRGQDSRNQVAVDQEALLYLVQRKRQDFDNTIFRRDFVEAAVGIILIPVWVVMGKRSDLPWTWYLVIPGIVFVIGYLLRNRVKQRRNQPQPGDSVRKSAERALAQIRNQITLLKNVFWWYLFPISLPMAIFFVHTTLLSHQWWALANQFIFVGLINWGVYELNQRAVRKDLIPRAEELEFFIDSLDHSDDRVESGKVPPPNSTTEV